MNIKVTREALDEIRIAGAAAHPLEACGLLLGREAEGELSVTLAVETRNPHPTPQTHFEIEPQALINAYREERDGGRRLIGYFHSHPRGEPVPSAIDQEQAPGDGRLWAIVAGAEVRFWKDQPGGFEPVAFRIDET